MTRQQSTPDATASGTFPLGGDLPVARIGYGAMKLSGWPGGDRRPDRDTALAVLRRAVELGVNHIDTSYYYDHDGMSANALIREALHPYPPDLVIVTKVGPRVEGGATVVSGERTGMTPDGLRRGVELNLRSLGVDRLDVVNLRVDMDIELDGTPMAPALETLAAMRAEGLIRHLGISNVTAERFAEARRITPFVCVQNKYNLVHRKYDAVVDACAEAGIAFVPFFPVSGLTPEAGARLETVAARHGATPTQVALAWLLARSPSMLVIPGTGSPAHLEENVAAGRLRLTEEDLAELDL